MVVSVVSSSVVPSVVPVVLSVVLVDRVRGAGSNVCTIERLYEFYLI